MWPKSGKITPKNWLLIFAYIHIPPPPLGFTIRPKSVIFSEHTRLQVLKKVFLEWRKIGQNYAQKTISNLYCLNITIPKKWNLKDARWKNSSNLGIFVKVYGRTRHKYNMFTMSNTRNYISTHICLWRRVKYRYFRTKVQIVAKVPPHPLTHLFIYLSTEEPFKYVIEHLPDLSSVIPSLSIS